MNKYFLTFLPLLVLCGQLPGQSTTFKNKSVLSGGTILKLAVTENTIYKLDYTFFETQLKLDADRIKPDQIKVFGRTGDALPEKIADQTTDDLEQIPIYFKGGEDGVFNPGDYILFYGEGPNVWRLDARDGVHHQAINPYTSQNFYFLIIDESISLRLQESESPATAEYSTTSYDQAIRLEDDRVNLLADFHASLGSGRIWFGDQFKSLRLKDYSSKFNFPALIPNSKIRFLVHFAGRSDAPSSFQLEINKQNYTGYLSQVNTGDVEDTYADTYLLKGEHTLTSNTLNVVLKYPETGSTSEGWLDYIELHARNELKYNQKPLVLRDYRSVEALTTEYHIKGSKNGLMCWDITQALYPQRIITQWQSDLLTFKDYSGTLKDYIVFDPESTLATPQVIGSIPNQNLHAIKRADLVIVYHPHFESEALRLAKHRQQAQNLTVVGVPTTSIYHEFSSGKADPTAIRNFVKMLRDRDTKFRYLILFGDASYDYRHLDADLPDQNFVPTYETIESLNPIFAFPTDDYYALLDDHEGSNLRGALDIAVGRLPVRTAEEAKIVVDKLIRYDQHPDTKGEWRNRFALVADDEEYGEFINQSERIEKEYLNQFPHLNVEKIYLDAFRQERTGAGEFYPDVQQSINNAIFKGVLAINYLGHGGSTGWAHERILRVNDILSWNNHNKLPLFITATCQFTGYDDASLTSAGEMALLNPNGGAIGLFTTVRAVYLSSNDRLTRSVFTFLLEKDAQGYPLTLGESLRLAKNFRAEDTTSANARKFALIGDPSMYLATPNYEVVTTAINSQPLDDLPDTIRALQVVTIRGEIKDQHGNKATQFNGQLFPTVYDKTSRVATLQQNEQSPLIYFQVLNNILFKGTVEVNGGSFTFSFVVPKDIDYRFGPGKISYYATDGQQDAKGVYNQLIVGGSADIPPTDNSGPEIDLYLDHFQFKSGGTTGPNTVLLANLSDEHGINVTGNGIGHDLTAVLDGKTGQPFILNEYYSAKDNNYTQGTVTFPLTSLSPGWHTLTLKAWDALNNSSEKTITFQVIAESEPTLAKVNVSPNPAVHQVNFQLEHNLKSEQFEVQAALFNLHGQWLTTYKVQSSPANPVFNLTLDLPSVWPGYTTGLYFYRISLLPVNGSGLSFPPSSLTGKVVIMR